MPQTDDHKTGRAQRLIEQLQLQPHPEGGWYKEVFRSGREVVPQDGRGARGALTSIYFLLMEGQHSRWHKVASDEVWAHLEGRPLDLWTWNADNSEAYCTRLGPVSAITAATNGDPEPGGTMAVRPQHVIAAGLWQAAQPQSGQADGFTLAACIVGPGFDFSDFQMMTAGDRYARLITSQHPHLASFI